MSEERPLHVRVAEALGWTGFSERGTLCTWWVGRRPEMWGDEQVPCYDIDWEHTGPLIEKYGISIDCHPWVAYTAHHDAGGPTPLVAVCNLLLALHAAGKLPR